LILGWLWQSVSDATAGASRSLSPSHPKFQV